MAIDKVDLPIRSPKTPESKLAPKKPGKSLKLKLGAAGAALVLPALFAYKLGQSSQTERNQRTITNTGEGQNPDVDTPPAEDTAYVQSEVGLDYPPNSDFYVSVENDTSELVYPISDNPETLVKQLLSNEENAVNSSSRELGIPYVEHFTFDQAYANRILDQGEQTNANFHTDIVPELVEYNFDNPDQRTVTFIQHHYENGVFRSSNLFEWTLLPRDITVETSSGASDIREWLVAEAIDHGPVEE